MLYGAGHAVISRKIRAILHNHAKPFQCPPQSMLPGTRAHAHSGVCIVRATAIMRSRTISYLIVSVIL